MGTHDPNYAVLVLYRAPLILMSTGKIGCKVEHNLTCFMFCDNDQVETHSLLSLSLSNDLKLRQNQLLSPAPLPGTSTSTTASISLSTMTAGFIFFQENNAEEV